MYLINTRTLVLEFFLNGSNLDYGVLSHRWEHEELTYQEMRDGTAKSKHGYQKILGACEQARSEGLNYMWVDTCCIDKSSSAELTEAINSMYAWYQDARVCYAYLADVDDIESLEHSAWFTRGWTLQELLAPQKVDFYTSNWTKLGSKNSLCAELSRITQIPMFALTGMFGLSHWTIAQRMSWAAKRVTTRPEDRAYSLMGIFGINMPLLYGEGSNAFVRLQKKIIKKTDDHSIFAWWSASDKADGENVTGLFASSPDAFARCSTIQRREPAFQTSTYAMTNLGLSITLPLAQWTYGIHVALLNCVDARAQPGKAYTVGIFLQRLQESKQWARVVVNGQDRILFWSECFRDGALDFKHNPDTVRAVFDLGAVNGPLVYSPCVWKQGRLALPITESKLYVRDDPDSRRLQRKFYGFWFRRFTPYPKDTGFDPQTDFAIRTWHAWDWAERRAWIPHGCFFEVCWIHVRKKAFVNVVDEPLNSQSEASGIHVAPSMLLKLYFSDNGHYDIGIGLEDNPLDTNVNSILSDPRSDAKFLSEPVHKKGGLGAMTYGGAYRELGRISHETNDRALLVTTEVINGVETKIVDLLWKGRGCRCDECGKTPVGSQFCCVSCESPTYDCCNKCFNRISDSTHDAKLGNRKHRFRRVHVSDYSSERPAYAPLDKVAEVPGKRLL